MGDEENKGDVCSQGCSDVEESPHRSHVHGREENKGRFGSQGCSVVEEGRHIEYPGALSVFVSAQRDVSAAYAHSLTGIMDVTGNHLKTLSQAFYGQQNTSVRAGSPLKLLWRSFLNWAARAAACSDVGEAAEEAATRDLYHQARCVRATKDSHR